MRGKAAQWGNSIAVRVPRPVADMIDLKPGEELEIVAIPGGLNIRRPVNRRYPVMSMAEMAAEMDRLSAAEAPEIADWGPDRGREVIDDTQ
jgi:antitoxin MazE